MIFIEKIFNNLNKTPEKIILKEVFPDTIEEIKALTLYQWIQQASKTLTSSGIKSGERIALIAPNSAKYIAVDLAILAIGAVSIPLYHRQIVDEILEILKDSMPSLIITYTEKNAEEIKVKWKDSPRIIILEELFKSHTEQYSFTRINPKNTAMLIYTSGTSGKAKGVVLTGENLDFMFPICTKMIDRFSFWKKDKQMEEILFHYLPLCFLPSRLALLSYMYRNVPVSLCMDINKLKESLGKVNPHCFFTVPLILDRIRRGVEDKISQKGRLISGLYRQGYKAYQNISNSKMNVWDKLIYSLANSIVYKKIKNLIGTRLEIVLSGSAPLSAETQEWFRMVGIVVCQAYGMTETSGIATSDNPEKGLKSGYIGYPVDGTEIKISKDGELLLKGPHIFQGYWNNKEETDKALKDGWLYTGDLAECDETGNYKIIGRTKNLIVLSSAHNIPSEPLENTLKEQYPKIKQAMLIGDERPHLSVIVTGEVEKEDLNQSICELNANVPHYKQIRKYIISPYEFTPENGLMTANLKMKRKKIEEHFRSDIDKLYADQ